MSYLSSQSLMTLVSNHCYYIICIKPKADIQTYHDVVAKRKVCSTGHLQQKKKVNKLQVIWDCYHVTCHLGVAQNKNVFLTLLYHHHLNISVWVLLQHVQNAQSDCMRPTTCATECVPVHFQHQQWLQSWPLVTDTLLLVCHCDVFSSICNPKEI